MDDNARERNLNSRSSGDVGLDTEGTTSRKISDEQQFSGDNCEYDTPLGINVYIFAGCAALNSVNLGYDIGANTGAAKLLQDDMDLSDIQLELFMGSMNLFAMIGAICSHLISDKYGRRRSFIVAAIGFIFGILVMVSSQDYNIIMFGRVFVGLGLGFGLAIDPLYISEISPAAHRGMLVTLSEIAISIGIVLGFSSTLLFSNLPGGQAWRLMFGCGCILPVALIVLAIFVMPESPRWLVQQNRPVEAARVLRKIYPPDVNVESIVKDIRVSVEKDIAAEKAVGWDVILFPSPAFQRMLLIGFGMAIAQQAVGIDAIQYFLVFILDQAGMKSREGQAAVLIALGLVKVTVVVIAGPLFDKIGRKPLLLVSLGCIFFSLFLLGCTFLADEVNTNFALFSLALYMSGFSLGVGPVCWLIPSEVFSTTIRAKAMSVATFLNRATATLMASTFLSIANTITWGGYFALLSLVSLSILIFVWYFLPETKGRTLEDMTHYFAQITGDETILNIETSFTSEIESAASHANEKIPRTAGLMT